MIEFQILLMKCPKCQQYDVIKRSEGKDWVCPCCDLFQNELPPTDWGNPVMG
jgi:ribosomal protein L37AE/L43A